jgi:hypothetical protein
MAAWTPEEDKVLKELYETAPREDILAKLPGRVWKSAYKRSVILWLYRPKDDAWKKEDDDYLKENYYNTPWETLKAHFPGRTQKSISWRSINILRLTRTKEITQMETRKTNLERRGVEYPTQSAEVRNKVQKAVQEKYGVDNVFQSEKIKEQIKETNLKNLEVENPNQSSIIRAKTTATNQKLYGVDNPFQMIDRVQKGMLKKYGNTCPLRVPEIKAQQQATNIKRYGFPTPAQNPEISKKATQTSMDNHQGIYHTKLPEIKEKIIRTNIIRYGVTNPAKAEEIKTKIKATTFKHFGVDSVLQLKEIRDKGYEVLKKALFRSKGEIAFMEYLKIFDPNVCFQVEHPEVHNIMDYYLPLFDLWCQYDGDYWHGKIPRALDRSKVRIIVGFDKVQNEKIPNLIRFWESDVKKAIIDNTVLNLIETKIKDTIIRISQ